MLLQKCAKREIKTGHPQAVAQAQAQVPAASCSVSKPLGRGKNRYGTSAFAEGKTMEDYDDNPSELFLFVFMVSTCPKLWKWPESVPWFPMLVSSQKRISHLKQIMAIARTFSVMNIQETSYISSLCVFFA